MNLNIFGRKSEPEPTGTLIAHVDTELITRAQLAEIQVPEGTRTHKPVAHIDVVNAVIESLGFRKIGVHRDQYAVDKTGMKMFGVMDLEEEFSGCRFSIGLRNSNDKSMRLAMTIGTRVLVCDNMSFRGDFTPVLAKHSASMSLIDLVSIGIDRMQRSFEPLKRQVEGWQLKPLGPNDARLAIYWAFMDSRICVPHRLMKRVHDLHFTDERFPPDRVWRLLNAFTSTFKELDPMKRFPATVRLGNFFNNYFA